jgi:predicted outer membrane protein
VRDHQAGNFFAVSGLFLAKWPARGHPHRHSENAMRHPWSAAALALLVPLALAACGAPSTPDFVQQVAMSDLYEVDAGKIAAAKGQSDAVKQFGQHMVEAHAQTTAELKGVVEAEKIDVALPTSTRSISA